MEVVWWCSPLKIKLVAVYKYCDITVCQKVIGSRSHICFNLVLTENKQTNSILLQTCIHFFKLQFELSWCQSVLVESVVPVDPVQNLQISAN